MADLNVKVGLDKSGFQTGLAAMENAVAKFGGRLTGALAAVVGVGAFASATKQSIELADRLDDLSKRFGVSASRLQLLGNVAGQEGTDIEALGQSLKFLGKNAQLAADAPSGEIARAFASIGVTGQQLRSLKPDELFLRLADAVSSGALAGQEFAVSSKLLGRGFEEVIPLLRMGREEIEKIGASKGIFTDQQIQQLAKVEDFLQKINNLKKIAAGEVTFGFIKSFKEFLGAGPAGSPARALRDTLFGQDKAPASRRSGGASMRGSIMDRMDEERIKELQKLDTEQARLEMRLIEARIKGRREAEQIAESFEDQVAEEKKRKAEERGRELAGTIMSVEELVAERQGPRAELDLQKRRAAEAAKLARDQGTAENVLAANQEANRLQRMLESNLRNLGFGDASFQRAQFQAQQITGMVPGVDALRDMTLSRQMQDPVQNTTVQQIANNLPSVLDRLDTLIRKAGDFSQ